MQKPEPEKKKTGARKHANPGHRKIEKPSVCKSGLVTGKRPEPDWTRTCQDRKLVGPVRTVTTVRSMVHHKSENLKTEQRPVLTGLDWSFKP